MLLTLLLGQGSAGPTATGSFAATEGADTLVAGVIPATEKADYFQATNVTDTPTQLFTGSVNGAWFDAEPISRFQVWNTSTPLTAYGQTWGQWVDRSGNANNISNANQFSLDTAFDDEGLRSTNIYQALVSTGGGGSTTGFYFCASLTGDYFGTIFSDVGTTNTGFQIQHNANSANDITFSVGTGAARVSLAAPSGQTQFTNLTTRVILEAWSDGVSLFLRVNRGVTKTASIGSAISAGTTGFVIGNNAASTDPWTGRIYQIVYAKDSYPVGSLRNSIAQFVGIKGQIVLAVPSPFGALDATEGADSFAASGTVSGGAITGQLAATEAGEDVFASTGNVVVAGALAATEAADSFAATGQIIVQGLLDATELADMFASAGTVLVQGALASTEGVDLFAASGQVLVQGSFIGSESSADSFESTGLVLVQGLLATSEVGQDVFAATGADVAQGLLAATEVSDAFAAAGSILVQGALAATESGVDVFAATGVVATSGVFGSLSSTEAGSDAFEAIGQVLVQGIAAITELGVDDLAGTGAVLVRGTASAAEDGTDTFFAFGGSVSVGSFDATEFGADVFSGTSNVLVAGTFAGIELGSDSFLASGQLFIQGSVSATEDFDQSAISGQVFLRGAFDALESSDIFGSNAIIYTGERLQKGILVKRLAASASSRPLTTSADHDNNQTGRRSNRGNYVGRGQSTPSR